MSDTRERELERRVLQGDEEAKHLLLALHLRCGKLTPVDPGIAEAKKEMAYAAARAMRGHDGRRKTPAQRKHSRRAGKRNKFCARFSGRYR